MIRTLLPLVVLLATAHPAGAALPPSPGRAIVITPVAGSPGAFGQVMFDPALGIDPRTLPGALPSDFSVLPAASLDTVSAALLEAERLGAAGCDTVSAFVGRPQVWDVAWYSPMSGGGVRCARRTRISLGALVCRARGRRFDPTGAPHTFAQAGLDRIVRLGGPTYAMGPPPEHGGQSAEIARVLDRSALAKDARTATSLRDWDHLAFDLRMDDSAPGRAVRLSPSALPPSPDGASDATWIRVTPAAERKALLALLDRKNIEMLARRPRRFALRNGVCGRYAVTLWDGGRQVSTLIDDAYLTPLEVDSLARDVADAIARTAPAAARAMREQLGLTGPPKRSAPMAALVGVDVIDPVAIRLAPSEGDEFLRPVVYRLSDVPDSVLQARFGPSINRADAELTLVGGWTSRPVSRATMHVLATVLARAATDDSTGLDPGPTPWPATWRASELEPAPGGALVAGAPRGLATRRIRGRAREWTDHLPGDAEDDARRVLGELVELGLPPAREFRGVGEDPPAPALPTPEDERDSLLVAARTGAGTVGPDVLGVTFRIHGGPPHYFRASVRLVAGDRAAMPANAPEPLTPITEASLLTLLAETLADPDLVAGAHRAYDDMAHGEPFLEVRIVERRHGGNPTRLLWVSFLDRVSGVRAVELLARVLAGTEPDAAADLRRGAQALQTGDPTPATSRGGS